MHFHHKIIGLILIYLLVVSRSIKASSDDTDVPNEYGEYEDEDEEIGSNNEEDNDYRNKQDTPIEIPHKRQFLSITTESSIDQSQETETPQKLHHTEITCPIDCFCIQNSHFFLNCSNRELTQIPKNIPNIVYEIDLSNNNITQVDGSSFANLPQLYKINLANNQIEDIESEAFRDSDNLKIIDLTNNSLTQLQSDTFSEASRLEQLWLAGNPIELPNIGPFLDQKGLKLLDLENCNLTNSDLQADLFKPLVVLKSLNLMHNFFEGNINTKTFEPLENLYKLRIPEISKWSIRELCGYLKAIDLIEVADKYMISCFELAAGLTFEESVIQTSTYGPPKRTVDEDIDSGLNEVIDDESDVQQSDTPASERTSEPNVTEVQNKVITTRDNAIQEHHIDPNSTENINDPDVTSNKKTFSERFNLADIPQEIINQILIGLILLVILALIISIIFRRDCCGIKTKLCRTRRPRHPTDQVQPIPEEVPLNKITTSS